MNKTIPDKIGEFSRVEVINHLEDRNELDDTPRNVFLSQMNDDQAEVFFHIQDGGETLNIFIEPVNTNDH